MIGTHVGLLSRRGLAGKFKTKPKIPAVSLATVFFFLTSASLLSANTPGSKTQTLPLAVQVPISLLHLGDQKPAYAFLVDKSQQKLFIYQQEEAGLRLVRTFTCATGENAGEKKRRGDKRTPEGVYFFTRWIEYKNLGPIYGIRAFPMDYPNLFDRRHDQNGGDGIWLHGTDKPLTPTSTNGCIVLENQDVADLSSYIRLKQTPIIIHEKIPFASSEEVEKERKRFLKILNEWKQSWERKDLDRYMSMHSKKFRCRNMDWEGWKNFKSRLNQQYQTIQVTLEPPMILRHKENIVVMFYQRYQSDKFRNEGVKRLYFILEDGEYKILGEEWDEKRGGEAAPPIPPTVLAAFTAPKAPPPVKIQVASAPAKTEGPAKPSAGAAPASPAEPKPASVSALPAGDVRKEKPETLSLAETTEIKAFLNHWRTSWERKELNRYMDCYSKQFRSQGKGWEQWKQHKKNLNARYRQIQVSLEGIQIKKVGDQVMVTFRQAYRSDSLKSSGHKSLTLKQEGSSWKIFREDFSRSRG